MHIQYPYIPQLIPTFFNNRIGQQQYIYLSPYILLAYSNLYLQMGSNNKCVVDFNASKKHWSLLNNRLSKWYKHRVLSIYQYWIIKRINTFWGIIYLKNYELHGRFDVCLMVIFEFSIFHFLFKHTVLILTTISLNNQGTPLVHLFTHTKHSFSFLYSFPY